MVFTPPTRLADYFASNVMPEDLQPYIGQGNPPAFISMVTYGRIFYLLIESTASRDSVAASISASYEAAAAGVSMRAGATYVNQLQDVHVKCFALGGDQASALATFNGDFNGVRDFLTHGASIRTGMPLSYVARALAPPHNIVNMAVAANYDMTQCIPVGQSFTNPIFWYQASGDAQGETFTPIVYNGSNHVTAWNNRLFADDDNKDAVPINPPYSSAGTYVASAVNTKAAVTFTTPSGSVGGSLRYPGQDFQGRDFTIVAVARLVNTQVSFPAYLMFGSLTTDRYGLRVGFRDASRITMTTGSSQILNAAVGDPTTWHVMTFCFSHTDGMAIYVNSADAAAGSDITLTQPLLGYDLAQIGSSNGAQIQIAEVEAYGIAFNDAQRQYVVSKLMTKYGI
jgi:hypothetical protein